MAAGFMTGDPSTAAMLPAERPRKRLVRMTSATDASFGKAPEERDVHELLAAGVVPLDKPAGPTSHQVAAWVRKALDTKEVGHGGTLDPKVTGVLPVAINGAVKTVQSLLGAGKEYVAALRLHHEVDEATIRRVAGQFVGKIKQTPPVRSAVKRRPRIRRVYYLDVLDISGKDVLFRAGCQGGTYIRTLCTDMAREMGTQGHMQELRRTKSALFGEDDLVTLHDCQDAAVFLQEGDDTLMRQCVRPVEAMTAHLPAVVLRDTAVDAVCHGAPLAAAGIAQVDAGIEDGELVALQSLKGELVALGKAAATSHQMVEANNGIMASVDRVVMRAGTYPRVWKRRT